MNAKEVKKAKIDGQLYDVVSFDNYDPSRTGPTDNIAIELDNMLLPQRKAGDNRPGMYVHKWGFSPTMPSEEEKPYYQTEGNMIDFSNVNNLREYIDQNSKLKDLERDILTNPSNIIAPAFLENDTPEMKLFKDAVGEKHVDLDKYKHRFNNYGNDRRIFNEPSITFGKLRTFCEILDIKATLVLEDKNSDVPNPIGKTMSIEITGGGTE